MKVAILTHFPRVPESPHGGVEAVSVSLAKGLASFPDLDVTVLTFDAGCVEPCLSTWYGVSIHRLPRPDNSELFFAIGSGKKDLQEYLKKIKPDLVHAHDTYGLMVKGLPLPRVFTIHGFIYGDTLLSRKKFPYARSILWKWFETRGWSDQPYIVSISPYVRERLFGVAKGIIRDIDNPISEDFFHITPKEGRKKIFSAAVVSPRKNALTLVKACQILFDRGLDFELRLAGKVVDEKYGDEIKSFIKSHRSEKNIKLLGSISAQEVGAELSHASIFALVSLEENSPMGIQEAMAVGLPVLTSNRCGMPYMVKHGESGFLVNPNDAKDVAYYLNKLLTNDILREEMGGVSRKIALERFHPRKVAAKTRDVYLEVVEAEGRGNQVR